MAYICYLVRMSMNFAHFAVFQALLYVDRPVPKKIVIFVGEMNVLRRNPSQNTAFFTKSEHMIKQAVALSSPVSMVYARNAWVFTSLLPSFLQH